MNPKEYYDYWNTYAQNNYTQACYNHASIYYEPAAGFPPNHASSEVKVISGSNYAGRNYQELAGGVVNNQQQWNQNQHNPDLYQLYHQTQMNMQQKTNLNIAQSTVFLKKYKQFQKYGQYSPTHVNRVYDMPGYPSPKSDTPEKSSVTSSRNIAMDKKFLSPMMATNQPKIEVHTPPSSCQSDDSPALRRLLTQPKIHHSPPSYFVSAATNNSLMKRVPIPQTPQSEAMELAETTADLGADLDAFLAMKLDLKTDEASTSNERINPLKKTGQNITNMSQGLLIYPNEAGNSRQSQDSLSVSIPNPPMPIAGKKENGSPALVDCKDPLNVDENGYFPWMKNMPNGTVKNNKQSSKRTRQTYTRYQTLELEKEFFSSLYLSRKRRIEFSHGLGLSERQIKIWFQNRRMKKKKGEKLKASKTENLQSLPSGELENVIPKVSQIGGGYVSNSQMNQHVYSQAMGGNTAPVHHQNYINQSMYSPTMDAAVNTPPLSQPLFSPTVDVSVNNLPTKQEFYSQTMGHTRTTAMYSPTTDTSVSSSPNISHTTFSPTMGHSVNLISPASNQELYSPNMDASVNNTHLTQQMYSPTDPSRSTVPAYSPTMDPSGSTVPMYSLTIGPSASTVPAYSPTMGPTGSTVSMYSPTMGPSASTVPAYSPTMGPSASTVPAYSPTMGPSASTVPAYSPTMGPSASTVPAYSPTMGPSASTVPAYSPTMGSSASTVPAYSPNMDPSTNVPLNLPRYSPIMGSSVSSAPMNQAIFSPPLGTDAPDNMNGIYGMGMNLNHMQGLSDSDIGFSDYPMNQ